MFALFFLLIVHSQYMFVIIIPWETMFNLYIIYAVSIPVFVSFRFLGLF